MGKQKEKLKILLLFVVYTATLFCLTIPHLTWPKEIIFLIYSLSIFWIFKAALDSKKSKNSHEEIKKKKKFFIYLLIFSLLLLLITRLIPFIRYGIAPLGYDTGFYLKNITGIYTYRPYSLFLEAISSIGVPPLLTLHSIYILSQFLIAGSLYILLRSIKSSSHLALSSIIIFLFATSAVQFSSYWWMFGQQMLATALLFTTISLIFKHPIAAILTGSACILIHLPTALIGGGAFFIFSILILIVSLFKKRPIAKKILIFSLIGAVIGIIAISLQSNHFITSYLGKYILEYHGLTTNSPAWDVLRLKGLFINPSAFYSMSLLVLPLALFTFLQPKIWNQNDKLQKSNNIIFLYIMVIILLILISFPFIYQHRFLIHFELVLLIFATPALLIFINYIRKREKGGLLLYILLISCFIRIGIITWTQEPQLYPEELQEIKAMAVLIEPEAKIMATSNLYIPWLHAFSNHMVIGPGYMNDNWDLNDWTEFWTGESDEKRHQLLEEYSSQLYLFIGERQAPTTYVKFIQTDPHFTQVSPHTWKYNPNI